MSTAAWGPQHISDTKTQSAERVWYDTKTGRFTRAPATVAEGYQTQPTYRADIRRVLVCEKRVHLFFTRLQLAEPIQQAKCGRSSPGVATHPGLHMYNIIKYLIYYLLPSLQLRTRVSPVL